jgi:hypothetical protein
MTTACPYCEFEAESVHEEVQHMDAAHPEIVAKRLERMVGGASVRAVRFPSLSEHQAVPPVAHLRKARARLDRVKDFDLERLATASRARVQPLAERKPFATDLMLVLRDYDRLLQGLLPGEDSDVA